MHETQRWPVESQPSPRPPALPLAFPPGRPGLPPCRTVPRSHSQPGSLDTLAPARSGGSGMRSGPSEWGLGQGRKKPSPREERRGGRGARSPASRGSRVSTCPESDQQDMCWFMVRGQLLTETRSETPSGLCAELRSQHRLSETTARARASGPGCPVEPEGQSQA